MPGLASTHDTERDETDAESIVRFIEKHVDSISAVLILVDHLSQDFPFNMDYTCSILSAIFPKTLVNNIAFVFTRAESSASQDFFQKKVPRALKSSPVFLFDNPIASGHWIYGTDAMGIQMRAVRKKRVLEMLVELFNWLDGLEPQPTTEITSLYEMYQDIEVRTIGILDQSVREVEIATLRIALKKYLAVSLSLCSHLALQSYVRCM
jgi:hypothetical protein